MRLLAAAVVLLVVGAATVVMLGRFWLGEHVNEFRPRIEAALSHEVAVAAHIGHLSLTWDGLLPEFVLDEVRFQDPAGKIDLSLQRITARIALLPILTGRLDFALLKIERPVVSVQRRTDGRLVVAGILLPTPSEEPGSPFVDWLLAQHEVRIVDGRLEWQDQRSGGRVLVMPHLQLRWLGSGKQHEFEVSADAPVGLIRGLRLSGTLAAVDSRHVEDWQGTITARADYVDVSQLRAYAEAPVDWRSGRGGIELTVGFRGALVQAIQSDARLESVALTLGPALPELRFDRLSGHLAYQRNAQGFTLSARQLLAQGVQSDGAPQVKPADFDLRVDDKGGSARADVVNLGALAALTESLPLPQDLRNALRERAPVGVVQGLQADWQGTTDHPGDFKVRARLIDVSVQSTGGQPGVSHVSGNVQADQRGGSLAVDAQQFGLALSSVFERPLQLQTVQAAVHWVRDGQHTAVTIDRLHIDDPDLAGTVSGSLELDGARAGRARLVGLLDRIEVPGIPRFLPLLVGREARDWLQSALHAGHARQVRLNLDGDLQAFPFARPGSGVFQVHIPVEGMRLDYGVGWPALTGVRGSVDFDGPGLTVRAVEGHQDRLSAREVLGHIADLDADKPVLELHGLVGGPLQSGLEFILQSPLRRTLGEFAQTFKATGDASLDLTLRVPLKRVDDTEVVGDLQAEGASLRDPGGTIPPITTLHGSLHFTESGVRAEALAAHVLGGVAQARLSSEANGDVVLAARGQVDGGDVAGFYGTGRLGFIHGMGDWQGDFRFGRKSSVLDIKGHLPVFGAPAEFSVRQDSGPLMLEAQGIAPVAAVLHEFAPPLIPAAEGPVNWKFSLRHDKTGDVLGGSGQFTVFGRPGDFVLGGRADALTLDLKGEFDASTLARVAPGLPPRAFSGTTSWQAHVDERPGQPMVRVTSDLRGLRIDLPAPFGKGVTEVQPLRFTLARLRGSNNLYLSGGVEPLLGVAGLVPTGSEEHLSRMAVRVGGSAVLPATDSVTVTGTLAHVDVAAWRAALEGQAAGGAFTAPINVDLLVDEMVSGRYQFDAHHWQARSTATGWHVEAHGPQIDGSADWAAREGGRLAASFQRLHLNSPEGQLAPTLAAVAAEGSGNRPLPAIELDVKDFQMDGRKLGQLALRGEPEAEGWHIARLDLTQPQGTLTAEGHWIDRRGRNRTRLAARLESADTGALLQAMGYPKALSRGKTTLRAALDWPGDPEEFSTARLGGTLDLDSRSGQFLTLEPGVGRLLGLLSLQALPRRVTLDFRDIFSQGFAFDSITGHFDIEQGKMTTRNLEMNGPAARVRIHGSTSLASETQDLDVRVSPAIGDGVSIASTVLGGPIVGAATYLVQKLLRNPIDQILTYQYRVTGSWDDPQVARAAPAAATPGDRTGTDNKGGQK
jgi:uncharacterized protein YhdP